LSFVASSEPKTVVVLATVLVADDAVDHTYMGTNTCSSTYGWSDVVSCIVLFKVIPAPSYLKQDGVNLTWQAVMKFVTWSLKHLQEGVWPNEPHVLNSVGGSAYIGTKGIVDEPVFLHIYLCTFTFGCFMSLSFSKANATWTGVGFKNRGQRMAFSGMLMGLKGDWSWEKDILCQRRSWQHNLICPLCSASRARDSDCPFQAAHENECSGDEERDDNNGGGG
jgi:hypothetical protein